MDLDVLQKLLSIIVVDLVLSADNAVVIGMAASRLSPENRKRAIIWGGAGAIGLRIAFTAAAALLLDVPLLQAIGGLLLVVIAFRLVTPEGDHDAPHITQAGSYVLAANLTVSTGSAITILTDGVTLDLNGFTIHSTAASPNGAGIEMSSGLHNLSIRDGSITSGVVNIGLGVYTGTGFAYGIQGSPASCRASGISVSGCLLNGIYLEGASIVDSCTVTTVSQYGLVASTVSNSVALDCGGFGIAAEQVSNSRGQSTLASGIGLYAFKQALNCQGSAASTGTGLSALTAQNCYGDSVNGVGLLATNATNCQGSSAGHIGLSSGLADNCTGTSQIGVGLSSSHAAQNCRGSGYNGIVVAGSGPGSGVAFNCYGESTGGGIGLTARIATSCWGKSTSNWGLLAHIANSCNGAGSIDVVANYEYDMP